MNEKNLQIYVFVESKYKNNIIPELPRILTSYLLMNPDKIPIYLNKDMNVELILNQLATNYCNDNSIDILNEIVKLVENNDI